MSSTSNIEDLLDVWINAVEDKEGALERNWWAIERVQNMREEPDQLWQFIIAACRRDVSDRVLANLAAGPLEELIAYHGTRYVESIVEQAAKDSQFDHLLGGVWEREDMDPTVWRRIKTVRSSVWPD